VFHPDGATIASGSADKSIIFWDRETGAERMRLEGHEKDVYSICFSADGGVLFSGSADHSIRVWPLAVEPARWATMAAAWRAADADDRRRHQVEQAPAAVTAKPKGLLGRVFGRR
jgi:hypothetical protein